MVRLAILLVSRRWGLIVLGIALVLAGLIWGVVGTKQINYVTGQKEVRYANAQQAGNYHIGTGTESGNTYVYADGSSDYYVALSGDFNPPIAKSDIDNSDSVSFIARSDTTDVNVTINGNDITSAHKIEKLVFYDDKGNITATYTTSEYTANPNGISENAWLKSIWLLLAGLIIAGAALIIPRVIKTPQPSTSFNIGAAGAQPFQQPNPYGQPPQQPGAFQQPNPYGQPPQQPAAYPQQDPYQQAYQGPGQYPQSPPAYPPAGSNPYQQPPQE
jgi:hypothetical protein